MHATESPARRQIVVIGGGAAGFFAAISCAQTHPAPHITILEGSGALLGKVRISGGGRCNVTHNCADPRALVRAYPRGEKELLGPFHRFGTRDTMAWFESRGVALKTEADGRVFPQSDRSATIIDALTGAAQDYGVDVALRSRVSDLSTHGDGGWTITLADGTSRRADQVVIASGSNNALWRCLTKLGLNVIPPVPSLFTFNTRDRLLADLAGLSVTDVGVKLVDSKLQTRGPLLVTHWGLSGPAILKLSALAARELARVDYRFAIDINWLGAASHEQALEILRNAASQAGGKRLGNFPAAELPKRLWQRLCETAGVAADRRWRELGASDLQKIATVLTAGRLPIYGKSTFKEEFVTAGGVDLKEMDFRDFSVKRLANLYIVGEALNIDAVTGGFNFQAAWTGGWLAGLALARAED